MDAPARSPRLQALLLALALATSLATLATAGVGLLIAIDNKQDIRDVHFIINSRMDELLEETRKNARAEGVIEGEGR